MSSTNRSIYQWEIWNATGTQIADISGIALNRRFTIRRNRAEQISCSFRLESINQLCASTGLDFSQLFGSGIYELRVKRGNRYLVGGKILYVRPELTSDISTVTVTAYGFLDLFKSRYIHSAAITYSATDLSQVLWNFINYTQGLSNGNVGVTMGTLATSRSITDTWQPYASSIKEIFTGITERKDSIDFEFTYNKVFNTYYPGIGTDKTELRFAYPGNIRGLSLPFDATELGNVAVVRGQGNGDIQPIQTRHDTASQAVYTRWEKIDDHPQVTVTATLNDYGDELLRMYANPTAIPEITVDGTQEPYLGAYWIGDRVKLDVAAGSAFSALNNQTWKINEIDVAIGEDDDETIKWKVGY